MVHFHAGGDGDIFDVHLQIQVRPLLIFVRRLTALIVAITALLAAIFQLLNLFGQ